ncbi:NAD(P)/FAD-dependent oxidoreductase [Marinilongibacter aquaticus]|uniref:NAD(P)/FAD-dependent oxidoreductase n=1 Tax=Marinilongibacter aquaticus TaxID=2975157 RepID=UPI0021BD1F0C|nr:NAD(P)/FAD-dependent oxidoreductase [Marinilongibacter aquaticus]UBM59911.1 NAD(P)/FAD-dependent oxidoreductase [Marinilongibacter aquaticus]
MFANLPETGQKRIVIVGAGFGGLTLAQKLARYDVQVVLVDKNNYHQFQPLFYQVAMAGLEPSAISFPIRKIFQKQKNIHVRITAVNRIDTQIKQLKTDIGVINYDYLVLAIGADTNYYGMENIEKNGIPMKSISEAIYLRNRVLQNFEDALSEPDEEEKEGMMSVVVVGGGPTGVELSGTLAEMRKMILPKDYPELDFERMKIYLFQSGDRVLPTMSDQAADKGGKYLEELGVDLRLGERVVDFDGRYAITNKGDRIRANNLVWAAGIKSNRIEGLADEAYSRSGRLQVDGISCVQGYTDVFAIGDMAEMVSEEYPRGHPQLAQAAIQQGELLAENLFQLIKGEPTENFEYKDLGSMATIGRNLAVVDLPFWRFQGAFAWYVWMFVHLMAILGAKNKLMVLINWVWSYITYDQSLRLIIKPNWRILNRKSEKKEEIEAEP